MMEFSRKELFALLVSMFVIGFLICYLIIAYEIRVYDEEMHKKLFYSGDVYLRNITFQFRNASEMHDAYGLAYYTSWEGAYITIRDNVTLGEFLRICNHEMLHLIFCNHLLYMNATEEEEYVQVLDDFVRFPICNELLMEVINKKG